MLLHEIMIVADTEDIYTKIFSIIAGRYGKQFTWDLKVKMMGKKHEEAAHVFIGDSVTCYSPYSVVINSFNLCMFLIKIKASQLTGFQERHSSTMPNSPFR